MLRAAGGRTLLPRGYSITVYRSGRKDVHRVESEDAAIRLINEITPFIAGAFADSS